MPLFEKRTADLANPPKWLVDYVNGGDTHTGESVTVERSLTIPGVLAGFSILTEDTASLPLILYRRLARGKERATDLDLYRLMHDEPNPEMTSMVFRELIMGHLLGWGNFFAQKIWDQRGRIVQLWPLNPAGMEIGRKNGERIYQYTNIEGRKIAFTQEEILHIPAFGFDGLRGYSRISMMRNNIALAMATEKYGGRVFANDARPGVVLIHPQTLDDSARKNLIESWNQNYGGAGNASKTAILEEGMDLKTIGFPPEDAQFIETQKWTISQISRVFRIPEFMLGQSEKSTTWGTGIEQQMIGYVTHTLRPWTVRIDQQLNKDLLLESEKDTYLFEHLFDELLRADTLTRMQAYAVAITHGIVTRNEAREAENRLPYEGGDDPLYPLNMTSASNEPKTDSASRNITPLLMDAARRIATRDRNELDGALKRYAEKDNKFNAWAEQFYKREFQTFIQQTFQPMIDAGLYDTRQLAQFIGQLIVRREADINQAHYEAMEPDDVLLLMTQEIPHA
jgi:HK97 family phage portal protein